MIAGGKRALADPDPDTHHCGQQHRQSESRVLYPPTGLFLGRAALEEVLQGLLHPTSVGLNPIFQAPHDRLGIGEGLEGLRVLLVRDRLIERVFDQAAVRGGRER